MPGVSPALLCALHLRPAWCAMAHADYSANNHLLHHTNPLYGAHAGDHSGVLRTEGTLMPGVSPALLCALYLCSAWREQENISTMHSSPY